MCTELNYRPRLFVTGDTHGPDGHGPDGYVNRFSLASFPEQTELTKEDTVLLAGDFGAVWDWDKRFVPADCRYLRYSGEPHRSDLPFGESKTEKKCLDWLAERPFTVAAVPGNHENYDRLYGAYPLVPFAGGTARKIRPNVYYLERGQVYTLAGRTVFAFGGAPSHDISGGILHPSDYAAWDDYRQALRTLRAGYDPFRIEHVSWWKEENPGRDEMDRGIKALNQAGWTVDLVLTHEAPDLILKEMDLDSGGLSDYLGQIMRRLSYRFWICGHYHIDTEFLAKQDRVRRHEGNAAAQSCQSREYILYDRILEIPWPEQ